MRLRPSRVLVLAALLVAFPMPTAAALFVVDDVADPLPVTGTLTLRQAITAANALPGPHQINFQIPGPGVKTIAPVFALPPLMVDNVFIDGYSQPGASPGANPPSTAQILVQLDGWMAGACHGLHILSSFNVVQGLAIMNFAYDGIRIEGTPEPGTRANLLFANFVGTDASGTLAVGNCTSMGTGIWAGVDILVPPSAAILWCHDNIVDRNLVSGNFRCGVQISSCPPSDCYNNHVTANFIGTDVGGMIAMGNAGSGVVLAEGTHDNQVHGNVVSANVMNGIDVTGNPLTLPPCPTRHNYFANNLVGVALDTVTPLGNGARGVSLGIFEAGSFFAGFAPENYVATNVIAYNGLSGIGTWEHPLDNTNCDRNGFVQNSIHSNGLLGIDLDDDGVTPNDPGDLDTRSNECLNTPLILQAQYSPVGFTTVSGVVEGGSQVHVHRVAPDPSGYGEGDLVLGSATPDGFGNWSVQVWGLVAGDHVTALATEPVAGLFFNTSEFSPWLKVTAPTGVEGVPPLAFGLVLDGVNPFRRATAFRCRLPEAGAASLRVLDVAGKHVRGLLSGVLAAGEHAVVWDGRDELGRAAPAGVYFVDFSAGERRASARVVKL